MLLGSDHGMVLHADQADVQWGTEDDVLAESPDAVGDQKLPDADAEEETLLDLVSDSKTADGTCAADVVQDKPSDEEERHELVTGFYGGNPP